MKKLDLETLWYERERQELLRAYEAIHGKVDGRIMPHDLPRPKLSDVLRCARLAKAELQIWQAAQREAFFTDEQYEKREGILPNPLSPFREWFRLKNDLYDYQSAPFARINPALREWARPDFDGDEVAALRRLLSESYFREPYIDDLAEDASQNAARYRNRPVVGRGAG